MAIKVRLREGETPDELIKRFKRKYRESGISEECRKREFFLKKSLARKEKSKRARIKNLRNK